jgi:hypothetical protein
VDGFERVPSVDLDFPPTVVLRFEKGHLVDVASEFQSYYDTQIAKLRSQLSGHDLADFKQSDGKLSQNSPQSGEDLHRLIQTKIRVLEIVWAYLYSGREQQAWSALTEMWPSQDLERIRAEIATIHERGILHEVDPVRRPASRRHPVKIYDGAQVKTDDVVGTSSHPFNDPRGGVSSDTLPLQQPVCRPKSILLRRPPPSSGTPYPSANEEVELVVDAAGKVHSARVINGIDEPLVAASAGWQFIPAFRDGTPVACRFLLNVSSPD